MNVCVLENSNLGGKGKIVDIDESLFGERKYDKGMHGKERWVFSGVESESNECFFEVVEERSKEMLLEVIKRRILPGTTVISECWRSYECLEDEGFKQISASHELHFKDPDEADTDLIEGLWSEIKCNLRGKRWIDGTFDPYRAEFMFRRHHRNDPEELTDSFLRAILKIFPPRMKDEVSNADNSVEAPKPGQSSRDNEDNDNDIHQPGPSSKKMKQDK